MAQHSNTINNGPFYWEMAGVKKDGSPRPSHLVAANHVGEDQRIYVTDSPTGGKHYWTFDIDEAEAKQKETRNLYEYPNHTDVVLPAPVHGSGQVGYTGPGALG